MEHDVPISVHDDRKRRCPKLDHEVAFEYCRLAAGDIPCERVLTCWWDEFDTAAFIEQHFTDGQIARLLGPQQDRLASLVALIRRTGAPQG